jgi:hypothetical protein
VYPIQEIEWLCPAFPSELERRRYRFDFLRGGGVTFFCFTALLSVWPSTITCRPSRV